jgi:predicted enzyme related to lactoylglutathione lyase
METMRTLWIAVFLLVTAIAFAQQEQKTVDNKANNGRIDYIEFPATDVAKTKAFYERAFGWKFTDYGPDYTSFQDGRIAGGFTKEDKVVRGGLLVVLYASDLAATEKKVRDAGGAITKDAFPFPGGRRFHFSDPSGNELAVWSER